ncbi:hypothetical protein QNH38_08295 [Paenibacillus polymyxa]|uniref:hypothetical protein n=1 Tax=Paenibacillus polymyxa TaxID=1406 RepID=UPI0024BFA228|nr:hypothetical protein [Paenibacillus polymyxa]WHX37432.1 hypothetical protein QNH38_08295 [Paenibacillus polymyxa]
MNSSRIPKDSSSLFQGVPIGNKKNKDNAAYVPAGKYSVQSSFNNQDEKINIHTPQEIGDSSMEGLLRSIFRGQYEMAPTKENKTEAGDNMEDSTKLLLERIERDSREREARYHKDAQEREQRYRDEMQEQDRRLRQEAKEREERILNAIVEVKTDLKQEFQDVKDESRTTRNTVIALTVAIIIGIAGMVITVVLTR